MRVYRRLAIDIASGRILEADAYEYTGSVAELKGGGASSSNTQASVPPEMSPLVSQSAQNAMMYQNQMPLTGGDWGATNFTTSNVEPVAGLSENQQMGEAMSPFAMRDAFTNPMATGAQLASDPSIWAAQQAFEQQSLPLIQNQMALAGLGHSSAIGQAIAGGEAQALSPIINAALQREQSANQSLRQNELAGIESAMKTGAVDQQTQQAAYDAIQQDFLRRQALTEEVNLGPIQDILPSMIGSSTVGKSSSGGK